MKALERTPRLEGLTIHRCIALVLGIGVVLGIVSFLAMERLRGIRGIGEATIRDRYDASIERATRILEHLAIIESSVLLAQTPLTSGTTKNHVFAPITPASAVAFNIASIREDVEALEFIQQQFANSEFEGVLAAVSDQSTVLEERQMPGQEQARGFIGLLDSMAIRVLQLRRLHVFAADELRSQLTVESEVNNRRFLAFLILVLAVSGIAISRLLAIVNGILREEKQAHQDLHRSNVQLEEEIAQGLELASQLRQAQKMEAIGQLTGGIAHDFNNLLTAILGHAELATGATPQNSPVRRNLNAISTAGENAARLIKQLLAFSRKQLLEPKSIDMNDVVAKMEEMMARTLGSQIELEVDLDPNLWHVQADVVQLGQMVMNLAVNARDAMPKGGALSIRTANRTIDGPISQTEHGIRPGDYASLKVNDTGTGMNPEIIEQIFDPFFTTKGVGQGTGLGLSTVYGIVKQSGGDVSVHSEVGKGTTFEILLPRTEVALDTISEKQPPSSAPGGKETILIVEDDRSVLELARLILTKHGYHCHGAIGPTEALRMIDEGLTFDLMITDVVMPTMNGRELAKRVRAKRPDLRVLFMSGFTSGAIQSGKPLESDTILLNKPFTSQEICDAVHMTLQAQAKKDTG